MSISGSEDQTYEIAAKIAKKISSGGILALFGDLGSGKTTFTKGVAKALGIDHFNIKSPTYTYIRHYPRPKSDLYHLDLYRLEEIDELMLQEVDEIMKHEKNIIIIEWADKMEKYLPPMAHRIYFEYLDENTRQIIVK